MESAAQWRSQKGPPSDELWLDLAEPALVHAWPPRGGLTWSSLGPMTAADRIPRTLGLGIEARDFPAAFYRPHLLAVDEEGCLFLVDGYPRAGELTRAVYNPSDSRVNECLALVEDYLRLGRYDSVGTMGTYGALRTFGAFAESLTTLYFLVVLNGRKARLLSYGPSGLEKAGRRLREELGVRDSYLISFCREWDLPHRPSAPAAV